MTERALPFREDEPLAIKRTALATLVKNAAVSQSRGSRTPRATGQVAVIPVHGTLATFDDPWFGISSTRSIGAAFDAAMSEKRISAVVLHVDSPGGTVAGTEELADKIFSGSGRKPIIAVADTEAASAAFWIATAADQLIVTPSGEVGSIGVWTMHRNISGALDQAGIEVRLISAGKYKVEGHPFGELDQEAEAEMQRSVNESYRQFLSAVAKHRGVSVHTVERSYGQGRMLTSRRALAAGMVDAVATTEHVISELVQGGEFRGAVRQFASDDNLTEMLCEAWNGERHVTPVVTSPVRKEDIAAQRKAQAALRDTRSGENWHYVSKAQRDSDELALARAMMAAEEVDAMLRKR